MWRCSFVLLFLAAFHIRAEADEGNTNNSPVVLEQTTAVPVLPVDETNLPPGPKSAPVDDTAVAATAGDEAIADTSPQGEAAEVVGDAITHPDEILEAAAPAAVAVETVAAAVSPAAPETSSLKINYASRDKGADVLEYSPSAKGAGALVLKDQDKYCITPCNEKLFVVLQLSEDLTMEKFVLANYEQYSSMVKDFQVFGSLKYPTEEWKLLGNFTALPGQGDQQFRLRSTV